MKEQDLGDGKENPALCALCLGRAGHAGDGAAGRRPRGGSIKAEA